jgi:A/G-specific adenine glycosylase
VLVSEVMLQQIQVVRIVPFYERFLERFPTAQALAGAPIAEVIRLWGDFGHYSRVVSLHKTARIIIEEHEGKGVSKHVVTDFPYYGIHHGSSSCT